MRIRIFVIVALVALGVLAAVGVAGATLATEGSQGGRPLHATLLPGNQVPPTASNPSLRFVSDSARVENAGPSMFT